MKYIAILRISRNSSSWTSIPNTRVEKSEMLDDKKSAMEWLENETKRLNEEAKKDKNAYYSTVCRTILAIEEEESSGVDVFLQTTYY